MSDKESTDKLINSILKGLDLHCNSTKEKLKIIQMLKIGVLIPVIDRKEIPLSKIRQSLEQESKEILGIIRSNRE